MGLIFDRNSLHVERLERFQAYLRKNVPGRRIRWNTEQGACGAKCLAGHMRHYIAMREGGELDWHQCPATFFNIPSLVWYNLVLVKGHSFQVNTKVLDLAPAEDRHAVASKAVEKLILTGDPAWYVAIRDVMVPQYGRDSVEQIVKWDYDRMG